MSGHAEHLSRAELKAVEAIALDAALAEVTEALTSDGIQTLLIKGRAVARWLYDNPEERPYGDIDLLVDPELHPAAAATLARLGFQGRTAGFRPIERSPDKSTWWRVRGLCVWLDLHHWMGLIPAPPAVAWKRLSEGAGSLSVAGVQIATPSPPAHLLILTLHAAHHGPGWPKPLEDLRRAIARVDETTWQAAADLGADLGAAGAMRAGLGLVAGGPALADRLRLADDASRLVRLSAANAPTTSAGLERLITTRGLRARLALLAHEFVPSPEAMRIWRPFARRGPPGLALAYLWRPVWLMAQFPRSGLAWVAAARPNLAARYARLPAFLAGAAWAVRAWWRCRVQLRGGGLDAVNLPAPPPESLGAENGIRRALRRLPTSCLESSLVRQSWHAAHGRQRQVVIGVLGPVAGAEAHAWLEGDPDEAQGFAELTRWPPPSD